VYHAAALGIVMEPSADKRQQLFYTEHTDDITSLAMVNSSVEKYITTCSHLVLVLVSFIHGVPFSSFGPVGDFVKRISVGVFPSSSSLLVSLWTDRSYACIRYGRYGNVAATGQIGEDADIHVWDTASLTTLSIIRGFHRTAVVALDFSASGKLLLSVDSSPNRGIAV
jgi:WD40 repeat protein